MNTDSYNFVEFGSTFAISTNTNEYKLKRNVGLFEKGSSWKILKNFSHSEMFRMYMSAKIIKTYFPDAKFYDLLFVRLENKKIKLAVRADVKLAQFTKDCFVGAIPFYCLNGKCEIEDDGFIKLNSSLERSVYYDSPLRSHKCMSNSSEINGGFAWENIIPFDVAIEIVSFEKVFLTTLMLDTHAVFCEDFALELQDDLIKVRLQNIEDNFLSLTKYNPNFHGLLSVKLQDQYDSEALKPLEDFETNVFLRLMRMLPKEFLNKMSYKRLVEAIDLILAKNNKLGVIVNEVIGDMKYIFGDSLLEDITFERSQFSKYRDKKVSFLTLKSYLRDLLDINTKNLEKFKFCIGVETTLLENNKESLRSFLYDDLMNEAPLCLSIYRLPQEKGYIDASQFVICKMTKTFKYQNEAADLLNSFCRGEVQLPEIEQDTLINEL